VLASAIKIKKKSQAAVETTFKTTAAPTSEFHPSSVASQVITQVREGRQSEMSNGPQMAKRRATFTNYDFFLGSDLHVEQ